MPIGVDGLVRQWTPSQSVHRQGAVTGIPGAGEDGTCDAVYGWGGSAIASRAPEHPARANSLAKSACDAPVHHPEFASMDTVQPRTGRSGHAGEGSRQYRRGKKRGGRDIR